MAETAIADTSHLSISGDILGGIESLKAVKRYRCGRSQDIYSDIRLLERVTRAGRAKYEDNMWAMVSF
jgi:hypothetical protein